MITKIEIIVQLKRYKTHTQNSCFYHAKTRVKPLVQFGLRKLNRQIKQLHNLAKNG